MNKKNFLIGILALLGVLVLWFLLSIMNFTQLSNMLGLLLAPYLASAIMMLIVGPFCRGGLIVNFFPGLLKLSLIWCIVGTLPLFLGAEFAGVPAYSVGNIFILGIIFLYKKFGSI